MGWRLRADLFWGTGWCLQEALVQRVSGTALLRPANLPDGVWDLLRRREMLARAGRELPLDRRGHTQVPADDRPQRSLTAERPNSDGGRGWRSTNQFDVRWSPVTPDGGTSIVGADYRVCPATNPRGSEAECITGRRSGSAVTAIEGISVPRTGVWRLEVALRDELGHVNLDAGATIDGLRLDVDAPRLAFLPRIQRPCRVQLSVSDEGSGVRSVAIEARRQGEKSWRALAVSPSEGRLTALLDDDDLPAGKYEVRGYAVDAVGNERSIGLDSSELIELPVRRSSRLLVGMPTARRNGRAKLDARPSVAFGAPGAAPRTGHRSLRERSRERRDRGV